MLQTTRIFALLLALCVSIGAVAPNAQAQNFGNTAEKQPFAGLAHYLNNTRFVHVTPNGQTTLTLPTQITLQQGDYLAEIGRFNVSILTPKQATQTVSIALNTPIPDTLNATTSAKNALPPQLQNLRYSHLWLPLAKLTMAAEWGMNTIHKAGIHNWGLVIIIFAIFLKIITLPVAIFTVNAQRRVSHFQAILSPQIADIKKNYDNEEAHNRLMAIHKVQGITPFYTLRPMLGLFIQIPLLIATFNALAEMPQFAAQSFLWIPDLAYPDSLTTLPITIPMLGGTFNLLPFLMSAITVLSTYLLKNSIAPQSQTRKMRNNLYVMTLVFLVLFYPFPASMVLFWAMVNLLQAIQQQMLRI